MSSGYNELKLEVLAECENWDEVTAGDMANALGRTPNSISKAMSRYHNMGLLSRYTIYRNEKVYSLTDRGLERLEWLIEQDSNASDDDDVHVHDENENDESDTEQEDNDGLNDYEALRTKT